MKKCFLLASFLMTSLALSAATPVEPHNITLDVMESFAAFYADNGTIDHNAFRKYASRVLTELNYREVSSYDLYPHSDGPSAETMWYINTYMAASAKPDGYTFAPTDDGKACMIDITYYNHDLAENEVHSFDEIAVTMNTLNIAQYNLIKYAAESAGYKLQKMQIYEPNSESFTYDNDRFELMLDTFVQPNGVTAYSARIALCNHTK